MLLGLAGGGKPSVPATPPTLLTATVPADGLTIALVFTVPSSPLLPAAGITGLTCTVAGSNATFTSSRTAADTITLTMTTTIYDDQVVTVSYAPGNITDTATTALEAFTNTAVTNNSTAVAPYVAANCLSFDGVNEYCGVGDDASLDFTTAMTMSFWVKGTTTSYQGVVMKADTGSGAGRGYGVIVYGGTPGCVSAQIHQTSGSAQKIYTSSMVVMDGTWRHVVFTFASSTLKLYIDRTLDTPTLTVNDVVSSINPNTAPLRVAAQTTSSATNSYFTGKISNLSLWNIALDQTAINALATSGKPADLSLHANYANCVTWHKLGDGDTIGASGILDTKGTLHMSPTNMESGDIVTDAP